LLSSCNAQQLGFDEKYAEEITQRISERTDVERIAFPQTIMAFAGPSAAFERKLVGGELRHDGNRLLKWQAGNVQVKADVNNNIRPVKEKRGSLKSVDGIVASIMALGLAMETSDEWVYESGSLAL
jgi:phage terminase large subunit-like protein